MDEVAALGWTSFLPKIWESMRVGGIVPLRAALVVWQCTWTCSAGCRKMSAPEPSERVPREAGAAIEAEPPAAAGDGVVLPEKPGNAMGAPPVPVPLVSNRLNAKAAAAAKKFLSRKTAAERNELGTFPIRDILLGKCPELTLGTYRLEGRRGRPLGVAFDPARFTTAEVIAALEEGTRAAGDALCRELPQPAADPTGDPPGDQREEEAVRGMTLGKDGSAALTQTEPTPAARLLKALARRERKQRKKLDRLIPGLYDQLAAEYVRAVLAKPENAWILVGGKGVAPRDRHGSRPSNMSFGGAMTRPCPIPPPGRRGHGPSIRDSCTTVPSSGSSATIPTCCEPPEGRDRRQCAR